MLSVLQMTEPAAFIALAAVAMALRILSGGALPLAQVPAEIVPGNVIKAGSPGVCTTRNP